MCSAPFIVRKFGGTSVGTPAMLRRVIDIILEPPATTEPLRQVVIVSAFHGITNTICELTSRAANGDDGVVPLLDALEERHLAAINELIGVTHRSPVTAQVKVWCNELRELVHGISLVREASRKSLDTAMSYGERLCAFILAHGIRERGTECRYLDLRPYIRTDNRYGSARVIFQDTYRRLQEHYNSESILEIATGFIGSTSSDDTTTLGRGGSDYTASIVGAALGASVIEIWTDVDGVLTADPRKVQKAFALERITYEEAMELSHFGAKVIYPPTLAPARELNIPIRIRNTFNPDTPGTLICTKRPSGRTITGISSIDEISLLRVQGTGMIGVAGVAMRLFSALARGEINVILITQASSEYTICFAVAPADAVGARDAIELEFAAERAAKLMDDVIVEDSLSIVSVIGEEMSNRPGIAGSIFSALGRNGINVIAIAQGSSELNISTVVRGSDVAKALNAIHDEFFEKKLKTLNLFIVGAGLIGKTLINQISNHAPDLAKHHAVEVRVCGVANSRRMLIDRSGIAPSDCNDLLDSKGIGYKLEDFLDTLKKMNLPNCILVDCTASEALPDVYQSLLKDHINIVTPNKRIQAGAAGRFLAAKETAKQSGTAFLYETSVGAGLPIIGTLNDLIRSGDEIIKIEAVLSGTLSFIFNSFCPGRRFSDVVREAKALGYTEPDPRDDLSGMDVMRKLLILAREAGAWLEPKDVVIESLVPDSARGGSVDEFFERLGDFDAEYEKRAADLAMQGQKLCYIAAITDGKAQVRLTAIGSQHPFFGLSGSDNIVSFTTARYRDRPLVVKGPGAGAEVTAAGVFADIVRIAHYVSTV